MGASRKSSRLPRDATEIIVESISDGVFTVDHQWRITSFNRAAEEITGVTREEAIGQLCSEVFRASMCEVDCALRRTMDSGDQIVNKSGFIVSSDGAQIPISVSTALLRDKNGKIIGGVETFRDLSLVEELRKELEGRFQVGDMVSHSSSMRKIFDILPQVAASDSTVLIQGETGTGKELLAQAIHNLGARRDKPFIAVNCGALPDTLLESELFGYKAGAFTGADKDKPGRFALAEGGTIFLDEIGDVSSALQVRLLRVLQEKTFEPLGGTKSVTADIRFIAATNKYLAQVDLPPLRKRKEDVPLLVEHFVARQNRLQAKSISGVSPEVLAFLMAYNYPGNIRELENMIEYAFVLCANGQIELSHLPHDFVSQAPPSSSSGNLPTIIKAVEAQAIRDALKRNHNNRLAAARELGVHKSTLFRKMKALGISGPDEDGRSRKKRRG